MRVMDIMLAIPSILLAITLMAALGKGIDKAVIAIGLVSIPEYARIVRGNTLSIKENDYVAAARIVGQQRHPHHLPARAPQRAVGDHRPRHPGYVERHPRHWPPSGSSAWACSRRRPNGGTCSGGRAASSSRRRTRCFFPGMAITLTVLAFNLRGRRHA